MLQADAAAVVEERLKVLIIIVQIIFVAEQDFDHVAVAGLVLFHLVDIGEASEAAGDVTRGQRIAFVSCDDSDHVVSAPSLPVGLGSMRRSSSCSGRRPKASGVNLSIFEERERSSGEMGSP